LSSNEEVKEKITIIAEAGVNHNGDYSRAIELIDVAAECGADFVKFQTFQANKLVSKSAALAEYQMKTTSYNNQSSMLTKLELKYEWHQGLIEHAARKSIGFISTPFDDESIMFLSYLGLDLFKIPSGEINNLPYLRTISKLGKKVILSTGMANLGEIESAIKALISNGLDRKKITLLHCTTEYPAPFGEVNLLAMNTLKKAFNLPVGYSDHTEGIAISIAAAALGARVIEKHFTLDRGLPGPDHMASIEPHELANMIESIRQVEESLGLTLKEPSPSEAKNMFAARRSLVASKYIAKAEQFTTDNVTAKRPGNGISPMRIDEIIGRSACRSFEPDDLIEI
jgi:N,N'-diacetyllegionaminate synthase